MRHNARVKHFGRKTGPRKALWRGLVNSLVEHGRIKTTLAKAKELRRHVEKAITVGKKQTLHARRLLLSRYPNEAIVSTIMSDIAPRFQDREGGYTRILKLGMRPGDAAEMAYIQFVDFNAAEKAEKLANVDEKAVSAKKRTASKAADAKKKRVRKLQGKARAVLAAKKKKK
jgi:large subunit ribosomal protein L17